MVELSGRMAAFAVLNALQENPRLSSVNDLKTKTHLQIGDIKNILHKYHPDRVQYSGIRNNAGFPLFAPADRELSTRAKLVGSRRPVVRAIMRWWYVGQKSIDTCDL